MGNRAGATGRLVLDLSMRVLSRKSQGSKVVPKEAGWASGSTRRA